MKRQIKLWLFGIGSFFINLVEGFRKADDVIMGGGEDDAGTVGISQRMETNRVSHALLRGEVTQEVEDLRYRTYLVDREAKEREYFSPTLTLKRDRQNNKFLSYEHADGGKIITKQAVSVEAESVNESILRLEDPTMSRQAEFNIKLGREYGLHPRFMLEEYTKFIVIREHTDKRHYLDFYVSIYPNKFDFKSKGFISEIKKIRDGYSRSDVVNLERLFFTTYRAYNFDDMCEFEYDNIVFKEIVEFDGHYVVRFTGKVVKYGVDVVKRDYYSERMQKKYDKKERKDFALPVGETHEHREYICERCGKKIVYDTEEIDFAPINMPRDIVEDDGEVGMSNLMPVPEEDEPDMDVTEYLDAEVIHATYGKYLCKECLAKHLEELEGGEV